MFIIRLGSQWVLAVLVVGEQEISPCLLFLPLRTLMSIWWKLLIRKITQQKLTNLQMLWSLRGGLVVVLPCSITRDVRRPRTFILLTEIGIYCYVRSIKCLERYYWPRHRDRESGAWLNNLPLLDSESLKVAIALRVGADFCVPHSCRCCGRMDSRGSHGLPCKYSAGHFPKAFGNEWCD